MPWVFYSAACSGWRCVGHCPFASSFSSVPLLGALTVFFGLRLVWLSVNGTFLSGLKQILIALLAVVVGNLLGKLLGLQKISNQLGRYAGNIIYRRTVRRPAQSG